MIEGTPAITITLPIQKPGAPDTLLRTKSARIDVDRHTERLGDASGGDVIMGRPDPAGGEDIGAAMPERIQCVDDRSLLVADHPDLLEVDADGGQILRDIADVLVLGAAGQDLATDYQERGRDNLFGSERGGGWHDYTWECSGRGAQAHVTPSRGGPGP
jgi:hypothetical protein